jgi:hypothetical protein
MAATIVLSFVRASRREPVPPIGLDLVVTFVEPFPAQHLVELEGVSCVDRIDGNGLAFDIGGLLDVRLNNEMIEAVVAA